MLAVLTGTANESSFIDTLDRAVIPFIAVAATLIGAWLANNYRRQMRLKLADQRRAAYSRLWEITGIAAPIRLDGWGKAGGLGLSERQDLYDALTDWYYADGNGMLLTRATREVYLNAKHNLVCKVGKLRPGGLERALPRKIDEEQLRGILAIKQMSLLRTQLKSDLAIYGQPYVGDLETHEAQFLSGSGVNLGSKAWAKSAGRMRRFGWTISWARGLAYWIRTPSVHRREEKGWKANREEAKRKEEARKKDAGEYWYNPSPILNAGKHVTVPSSSNRGLLKGIGEIRRRSRTRPGNELSAGPEEPVG